MPTSIPRRRIRRRNMKKNKLALFSVPYVLWMAVFVVIPILMIVVYAFSSAEGGFTL